MSETTFVVRNGATMTPRDLLDRHRAGYFVSRSSHIGNQYLSNLFLLSLGLPACLYDRTTFGADCNYHPGAVFKSGASQVFVKDRERVLVPFGPFWTENGQTQSCAKLHVRALEKTFPGLVETESAFLLRHETRVARLLDGLGRHYSLFDRWISSSGEVTKTDYSQTAGDYRFWSPATEPKETRGGLVMSVLQDLRRAVYNEGVPSEWRGGYIPKKEIVVIMTALAGYWATGKEEIYELSGPDMVKYAFSPDFLYEVGRLWHLLHRESLFSAGDLPKQISLTIVPTADFRFGYLEGEETSERAMAAVEEIFSLRELKEARLREVGPEATARRAAAAGVNAAIQTLGRELSSGSWNIFYDIREGNFFSQHDLVATGKTLKIPPLYLDLPFLEIEKHLMILRALLRR